jgi:hypothetical protein
MYQSSSDHHQAVLYNMKVNWTLIMDSYFGAAHPYYKSCISCALCYNENYNIKILKYQKVYKKLYLKMLVDTVISKVSNMLKDIIY